LEKRGPWNEEIDTQGFVAGCDICQEVCPYNTKPVKYSENHGVASYLLLDEEQLRSETEEQYHLRVKDTALSRIKYADFRRNLNGQL